MTKLLILAAAAPLALAACSGGGDADSDGDGEISAEEAAAEARNANVRLEPGKWRMTMELTEIDAPEMSEQEREMMRSFFSGGHSVEQCMTEEDVSDPQAEMFGGEAEQNCSYTEFSMRGGNMVMSGQCEGDEAMGTSTMHMEGTYSPERYEMNMETVSSGTQRGTVTMRSTVTGERIGECDEETAEG